MARTSIGGRPRAGSLSIVRAVAVPSHTFFDRVNTVSYYLIQYTKNPDAKEEWANYTSLRDTVLHIDLRNWADICVIAPLSAHSLAKIAHGLCDDLLTCCIRAWDFGQASSSNFGENRCAGKPLILAPAMNTVMWYHPLTKIQLGTIVKWSDPVIGNNASKDERSVIVVEPAVKTLACGDTGAGALAELDDIVRAVSKCLAQRESDGRTANANINVSHLENE